MRTSSVLLSAFHFILASVLIMGGIFILGLGKVPHMKVMLSYFLESNTAIFSIVGMGCIALGALLFVLVFTLAKKVFYQVKMNEFRADVDPTVIETYVKRCIEEVIEQRPAYCEVIIRKDQKIEILTKLPLKEDGAQEKMLLDLEKTIGDLLKQKIGYTKEFFFTVTVE